MSRGFTVIEVVVVLGITSIMITALLRFIVAGYPLHRVTYLQQRSTETARIQLKRIAKSIREARPSDTGAYPLVEMSPQKLVFYADVDNDGITEKLRYELDGTDLIYGITKPTGDPIAYREENEKMRVVTEDVRNGFDPIFIYYSADYPVDQNPLTPIDVTDVKYIQFSLLIDINPDLDPPPIHVLSQVQLRNLKDNLGEVVD
jgi:prepilin-type N-terminal cleavage/methylation domain-containing protein